MRELPIWDAGAFRPEALAIALTVMANPDIDVSDLASTVPIVTLDALRIAAEGGEISRWTRQLGDEAAKAAFAGTCAGELLLQFVSLSLHRPDLATMNKCLELVWSEFGRTVLNDGTRVTTTTRSIQTYWAKYKSVSHYWAALRLLGTAADLEQFFFVSETLADAAEKLGLSLGDMWVLPVALPRKYVSLTVPAPTPEALRVLEEYRAPRRKH